MTSSSGLPSVLENIGLSEGERKVYLSLLKLGSSPVAEIKKDTGLHRTTIYDFLESLQQKSLASSVKEKGVQVFSATDPRRILEFVDQTRSQVEGIMPMLRQLAKEQKQEIEVEVLRGREGFKAMLNEILRDDAELTAAGIDEEQFKEKFESDMDIYFTRRAQRGKKERLLTKESATHFYKHAEYRLIPDEYFNPTPTFVWKDKVCVLIWEPLTIIRIRSEQLADSYRKHFELLWNMAREKG